MATFWKPGAPAPDSSLDREGAGEGNLISITSESASLSLSQQRQRLPIFKHRNHLLYSVEKFPVTIVVGETGSGKTTQLPQYLYESGWAEDGMCIACTQPRRVAATTIATRVAAEVGTPLGEEVGYTIRFEDVSNTRTKIKYLTDGMLFREALVDPLLSKYRVIMIDEAHERSLYADILLGIFKKIIKKRPDLHLIVASATINAEAFATFFSNDEEETTKIVSIEGRMYPVDIQYLESPCANYVEQALQTVIDIHLTEPPGDILVFLTGREEIEQSVSELTERVVDLKRNEEIMPLPLYSGLSTEQQLYVFEPTPKGMRKIIFSTNVAEASVTVDGIGYVVDCGFVKIRAFNPRTGMDMLTVTPESKASAKQRAGRAGRISHGKAMRLFTEEAYMNLREQSIPEIQRSDLAPIIMQLKALGIENVLRFDFVTPPPAEMMVRGIELLYSLKAVDGYGRLTIPLGMQMAEFPVDPKLAKILLDSSNFHCSEEMLTIAAMTTVQNVFNIPTGGQSKTAAEVEMRKFSVSEGDHLTLLNVYNAFVKKGQKSVKWCKDHYLNFRALSRAVSVRNQLRKYLKRFDIRMESCNDDEKAVRKCLVSGYFAHAAKVQPDGSYRTVRDDLELHIHPSSVLYTRTPKWVIFHEVLETSKAYMRDVTVIDKDWLTELAPDFYRIDG